MPDIITGNTELVLTKQDLIAAAVQKELRFAASLSPTITDVSEFAEPGLKSVRYPKFGSFTVQKRPTAVAGDIQTLAATVDTLLLDENAYISWLVDASDELQSRVDVQVAFAARAAAAHGRQFDLDVIARAEAVHSTTAPVAAPTSSALKDIIIDAISELKGKGQLQSELGMTLILSNTLEAKIRKIADFVRADAVGGVGAIGSGVIGMLYGVPVKMHHGLATDVSYLYHNEGLVYAFQKQPTMAEQPEVAYGTNSKRVAIDCLYGIDGMQLGVNGVGATKSALVLKPTTT